MLQAPSKGAMPTLERLATTQARRFAKTLARRNGRPWKRGSILARTLPPRARLSPDNAQTFQHGQGDVIGHQGTNIVRVVGDLLLSLRPIPF
jgi:hypothetical protein